MHVCQREIEPNGASARACLAAPQWHFTIRGPPGTAFDGGRYHGRITLPPEYPFKPPSIALLTPSGRFEVGKKICLSVSEHNPEGWQPAWGIRTIITALIAFFPTKAEGALAGLDYTAAERRKLAAASRGWSCAKCVRAAPRWRGWAARAPASPTPPRVRPRCCTRARLLSPRLHRARPLSPCSQVRRLHGGRTAGASRRRHAPAAAAAAARAVLCARAADR